MRSQSSGRSLVSNGSKNSIFKVDRKPTRLITLGEEDSQRYESDK